ncbi:hypothetical protein XENTR_v10019764 [Xenopus tropicalis]|nr:hypothetical protein XENTR_v10019764 [Xenopus tropicalis]
MGPKMSLEKVGVQRCFQRSPGPRTTHPYLGHVGKLDLKNPPSHLPHNCQIPLLKIQPQHEGNWFGPKHWRQGAVGPCSRGAI